MVNSKWVAGSSTGTLEPSIKIIRNRTTTAKIVIRMP